MTICTYFSQVHGQKLCKSLTLVDISKHFSKGLSNFILLSAAYKSSNFPCSTILGIVALFVFYPFWCICVFNFHFPWNYSLIIFFMLCFTELMPLSFWSYARNLSIIIAPPLLLLSHANFII